MKFLATLVLLLMASTAIAQVTISPWKMNKGAGAIPFNVGFHGNPAAYNVSNIPEASDSNWELAPVNATGGINYSVRSILTGCLNQLDFTYFETFLNIPSNFNVTDLNISFSAADDGARAYIFNSAHPNGDFIGEIRLGQTAVTANYAALAMAGEINRLVIVQFDDCPTGNNLTGAQVQVNGQTAVVNTDGCTDSNFFWSNAPTVSGQVATGTINGVGYTYTSSVNVRTTTNLFSHAIFPASYNVPNNNPTIQNIEPSSNTLTFASPMTNPVLVFSSIGGGPISVPINFSAPVEILWSTHIGATPVVQNSPTQITGTEGYAIVRMNGTFSSISFDYLVYENYVNFAFGADFSTTSPDTVAPTLTLNGNATESVNGNSTFTDLGATATDLCDDNPAVLVSGTVNTSVLGDYTLTYTAVDASGNTSTPLTRVVTVIDITPPTLIDIPVNTIVECNVVPTAPIITATDDFTTNPVVTFNEERIDGISINNYILTRTWTATDESGNTVSKSQIITVQDTSLPTAITKDITVQLDANGNASITPDMINNGSSDNCGGTLTYAIDKNTFNCNDIDGVSAPNYALNFDSSNAHVNFGSSLFGGISGSAARTFETWVKTTSTGNVSLVHIGLNQATRRFDLRLYNGVIAVDISTGFKVFTTPVNDGEWHHVAVSYTAGTQIGDVVAYIDGVQDTSTGQGNLNYTPNTVSGQATLGLRGNGGNYYPFTGQLDEVRIWNTARTATQIQNNYNQTLSGSESGLVAYYNFDEGTGNTVNDLTSNSNNGTLTNTNSVTWVQRNSSATGNEVTLTVTDVNGNSSTATANVTVQDNIAPTAIAQDFTVQLDASGNATITAADINNGSSDNCGIDTITLDRTSFDCDDFSVSCSGSSIAFNGYGIASGGNGDNIQNLGLNQLTMEAWVKPNGGSVNSVIRKAGDYDLYIVNNIVYAEVWYAGRASSAQYLYTGPSVPSSGWSHLAFTFDKANNGNGKFYVNGTETSVNGVTRSITPDITLGIGGSTEYGQSFTGLIDDVRIWSTERTSTEINEFKDFCIDANSVGLEAYFKIEANEGTTLTDYSGNGNHLTISGTSWSFEGAPIGSKGTEVTLTITDNNGNSSTATANVIVLDNIAPTVVGQDISVTLTASGTVSIVPEDVLDNGSDNCGTITYTVNQNTFGATDAINSPVTVQLTGTDASGNATTVPVLVTVIDPVPVVITQDITVSLDLNGNVTITPEQIDNGSSSVIGLATEDGLVLDITSFNCSNVGTPVTVTLTVTSTLGSSASGTATVSVQDNIAPTAIAKDITVQLDENGNVSITPDMINDGSSDNCEISSIELDKTDFDCSNLVESNEFAVDFNTSLSQGVRTVNNTNFPLGNGARTLSAWVNLDTYKNGIGNIIHYGNNDCTGLMYGMGSSNGKLTFWGGCRDWVTNLTIPLNQWVNIAMVYNGAGTLTAYVNGNSETFNIGSLNTQASRLIMGLESTNNGGSYRNSMDGQMDEVKMFNKALTSQEIQDEISGNNPAAANLLGHYQFEEGNGTSIEDAAGSNDAIFIGSSASDWVTETPNIGGLGSMGEVTLTVTDVNGNSSTTTANVIVEDNIAPQFLTTESAFILLDENGVATYDTASFNRDTVRDNCAIDRLEFDKTVYDCTEIGFHTITVTAFDVNGNSTEGQIDLEVREEIFPTVITKDIEVILDENGNASITPQDVDNGTFDNCTFTLSLDTTSFNCDNLGNNTVNLTATDNHGLPTTRQAIVRVIDNSAPEFLTTETAFILLDENGVATYDTNSFNRDTVSDNCAVDRLEFDKTVYNCDEIGFHTINVTAFDASGNATLGTIEIEVREEIAPTVITQNIDVNLDASGNGTITTEMVDNGSFDNCSFTLSLDTTSFNCDNIGENTVNLTATDNHGLTTTQQAIVNVIDNIAPVVLTKDIIVQLDENGQVVINPEDIQKESVWIAYINIFETPANGGGFFDGEVTDLNSLQSDIDPEAGTVTLKPNFSKYVAGDPTWSNGSLGNKIIQASTYVEETALVGQSFTFNGNVISNTIDTSYQNYAFVRIFTDTFGLLEELRTPLVQGEAFNVQYNNSQPSAVYVQYGFTIEGLNANPANEEVLGNVVVQATTNLSDPCGETFTVENATLTCANIGENTVTLIGTDANGNVATATTTVTVEDNIAPEFLTTESHILFLDENGVATFDPATFNGDTVVDNCEIESITFDKTTFNCDERGFHVINATATDVNGNSTVGPVNIEVRDEIAPTVITQNITIDLDANGNASIVPSDVDNGTFDNCAFTLSLNITDFSCAQVGDNVVELTALDQNGVFASANATVTVRDVTAPVAVAQNISVDLNADGTVSIVPSDIDNGSSDACPITLALDITSFDCSNVGMENVVTLTVTDASGNATSTTAVVTINDVTAPTVITQTVTVSLDENGEGSTTAEAVNNGSNDSCEVASIAIDVSTFDCSNLGDNTVTLTVTDINGNVASQEAIVTVIDEIAPIVGTQNISIELDASGNATITPEDVLILSEEDIERGDTCDVSAAENHAMYMSNYKSKKRRKDDDDDDDDDDDKTSRHGSSSSARFIFDENGGNIMKNLDGTAMVTGTLINTSDANDTWQVTLNLSNASNWDEWSALGRSWKGDRRSCGTNYLDWTYYEMAAGSKLTGTGSNTGKETMISHAPFNLKYGFQLGDTANLQNASFGLSGWFYYKNYRGRWAQGDFNLDVTNCQQKPIPEGTIISSDNCAIASYDLDIDSFNCDNLGENTVNVSVTDQSGNTTTQAVTVNVLGEQPVVTIPDFYSVYGQKKNTVFLGYAESVHLCPTVSGGTGFTYEWTDEAGTVISTEALPKVSPTVTTNYTVTVTNSNGCSDSATIEVCVIDARAKTRWGGYSSHKVKICHHSHSYYGANKHKTISVSKYAVRAHLWWHGDTLGSCDAECVTEEDYDDQEIVPTVSAYPNPSNGVFKVKLENFSNRATVALYNIYGRLIQYKRVNCTSNEVQVTMGSRRLKQGAYVIKVVSQNNTYTETVLIERRQ